MLFLFFKQKTAYDMRISDWSSDVCSSDLLRMGIARFCPQAVTVACAIEVGTIPSPEVRLSVIADNWLHLRGNVFSPQGQSIKAQIRAAFYPDSDDWRGQCYPRAVEIRSEEHTSELQSLMRISYAVFCLKNKTNKY